MTRRSASLGRSTALLACVAFWLLAPGASRADEARLLSVGVRGRFSDATVLGDVAPEDFQEFDAAFTFGGSSGWYSEAGWGAGLRLMVSAGLLRAAGDDALVVSVVPLLALGSRDGRFVLDLGIGAALLSRQHFGSQDFGGAVQFALTAGAAIPLYQRLGLGYRFMHYSDAALHGNDTTGADLHMLELIYRF